MIVPRFPRRNTDADFFASTAAHHRCARIFSGRAAGALRPRPGHSALRRALCHAGRLHRAAASLHSGNAADSARRAEQLQLQHLPRRAGRRQLCVLYAGQRVRLAAGASAQGADSVRHQRDGGAQARRLRADLVLLPAADDPRRAARPAGLRALRLLRLHRRQYAVLSFHGGHRVLSADPAGDGGRDGRASPARPAGALLRAEHADELLFHALQRAAGGAVLRLSVFQRGLEAPPHMAKRVRADL